MLFWRGCGILVLIITFAWIFVLIGVMIATESHDPDPIKAAAFVDRLFAMAFLLSSASVFLLARYRENRPAKVVDPATYETHLIPHIDEFMFIRIKYWGYVLIAASIYMFVRSFFE